MRSPGLKWFRHSACVGGAHSGVPDLRRHPPADPAPHTLTMLIVRASSLLATNMADFHHLPQSFSSPTTTASASALFQLVGASVSILNTKMACELVKSGPRCQLRPAGATLVADSPSH